MYANDSNAMQMIAKITDNDNDYDNENDFYKNEKRKKKLLLGRSKEKNSFFFDARTHNIENFSKVRLKFDDQPTPKDRVHTPVCSLGVQHPRPCRVRSCA